MSPSYFHLHVLHEITPMVAYVLHLAQLSNPQASSFITAVQVFLHSRVTIGWSTGCTINNPGFLYAIGCKFCVFFPGLSS